jgi:hypothetical protein
MIHLENVLLEAITKINSNSSRVDDEEEEED